jgi:hypothetical protein
MRTTSIANFDENAAAENWTKQNAALYEAKKEQWKTQALPARFFAFVLLGKPGIDLTVTRAVNLNGSTVELLH